MAKAKKSAESAPGAVVEPKKTAAKKAKEPVGDGPIELKWELAELPSAQHRAGLAGLVMLVDWIRAGGAHVEGVLEFARKDATGVTLRVDRAGMRSLYDAAYAASVEDKDEAAKRKNKKTGAEVPPKAEVVRESTDPKTGKTKKKTVYVYETTVPRGAFLLDEDPTKTGTNGLWIKLWRDFVWGIVRGVPASRGPYEDRANKEPVTDADDDFDALARGGAKTVGLAGTYYLGAQAVTADGVAFEDRERFQLLLQFWPFAASLYVGVAVDPMEGTRNFDNTFVVVIPDVSNLSRFCKVHFGTLRDRDTKARGYRPEGAAVDIPTEAGLDAASHLRDRLSRSEAAKDSARLTLGYEVVHVRKEGNNVRVLRSFRMTPSEALLDRYKTIEGRFTEYFFRRQQIVNLLSDSPWWAGYDRLFETLPFERFVGSKGRYFGLDARKAFADYEGAGTREEVVMAEGEKKAPPTLAAVVQRMVWTYATRRAEGRARVKYEDVKARKLPAEMQKYNDELERAAREAFLSVRSRTGADFREFFVGTICAVHQSVGANGYELLSNALRDQQQIDEVRTLTMLALSTLTGVYDNKKTDGN
jgi:CRISPR-associated protein Cmx8